MIHIEPFRALTYNLTKIERLSDVLAPPYDAISEELRKELAAHPHNIVHLILPQSDEPDEDARYFSAAQLLHRWWGDDILQERSSLSLCVCTMTYRGVRGETLTQKWLIGAVRLREYETGDVRPHEHTRSAPKEDRLKLLRATKCEMSQVQGLFSDPHQKTDALIESVTSSPPSFEAFDHEGITHRLWLVEDEQLIAAFQNELRDKWVIIADGHHRYETALTYRNELRRQPTNKWSESHPANFVGMALANLHSTLTILPTHRMLHLADSAEVERLETTLREKFSTACIASFSKDADFVSLARRAEEALRQAQGKLLSQAALPGQSAFAFAMRGNLYLLTVMHDAVKASEAAKKLHPALAQVDTAILHDWLLSQLQSEIRNPKSEITYTHDAAEAIATAASSETVVSILLNPIPLTQIEQVTAAGLRLPPKTTYFYPKLRSGLVMRWLQ